MQARFFGHRVIYVPKPSDVAIIRVEPNNPVYFIPKAGTLWNKYRPAIDRLDLRLLDILQRQERCRLPKSRRKPSYPPPTCWRRIQQLEQNGVIKARVALLDRNALGLDVTIFAHVKLATTGRDALAEFEAAIRDRAEVLECYTLTGEWDFLL